MISERLTRGESVTWQDDSGQWHVGAVLDNGRTLTLASDGEIVRYELVHAETGVYRVSVDALQPYPPRCEACGGEGRIEEHCQEFNHVWTNKIDCPACGGSGRQR